MKTAFITGSTQGIGRQIGIDLLKKGYFVYFNGRSDDSITNLERELYDYNNYEIIKEDLSIIDNAIDLASDFKAKHITFDVIIFNLGITDRTPFGEVRINKWQEVFDTNLNIPFFMTQTLRNNINKGGKIVFISSISGCTTDSRSIAYGVSKGAIHVLVPYLAKEFAEKKITVNAIVPGYINTNWHKEKLPDQIKRIEEKHLVKRLGTVKEISKAVLSVIDNDFINAQILRIDGGFLV